MASNKTRAPAGFRPIGMDAAYRARAAAAEQGEADRWVGRGLELDGERRVRVRPVVGVRVSASAKSKNVLDSSPLTDGVDTLDDATPITSHNALVSEHNELRADYLELKAKFDRLAKAMLDAGIGAR